MIPMQQATYQLTKHKVGSVREIWSMSWPLMITICSTSIMFFADRLFLARYSVDAMNALTIGGIWTFFISVLPYAICEITEVFVGKENGANQLSETAKPCWQMLWLSLFSWPYFLLAGRLVGSYIFSPGSLESVYVITYMDFAPFQLATISLSGFFIGIGKLRIITFATIGANLLNLLFAPFFIFILELGIQGAAIGAGLSYMLLTLFLLFFFLRKTHRDTHQTALFRFDPAHLKKMLQVAVPSGLGRAMEVFAHCIFFTLMRQAGLEALTTVSFVQSFYLLSCFIIDAIAKGATAVIANLIGAHKEELIFRTLKSAIGLLAAIACGVGLLAWFSCEALLRFTLSTSDQALLLHPNFISSIQMAMLWMSLFFLFDGLSWILMGHLTARSDTKFILYVNLIANWLTYLLPIYLLITYSHLNGASAWAVIACNSMCLTIVYLLRSKRFLAQTQKVPTLS